VALKVTKETKGVMAFLDRQDQLDRVDKMVCRDSRAKWENL
jgi:hypothetical protein